MYDAIPVVVLVCEFASRIAIAAAILLRNRGTATTRLAWLVVVFALPVLGIVAYLLLGETRLGRRRVRRYRQIVERIAATASTHLVKSPPPSGKVPHLYSSIAYLAESVGGHPPRGGNALRLYGDTDEFIEAIVADIGQARHHCHLEFYIYLTDRSSTMVAEALMAAQQRGVTCRLLVDAVGSKQFLRSELRRRLHKAGVQVVAALPANLLRLAFARLDLRNHRKIAVIDGVIAYSGSQNIADREFAIKPKYAPWVDMMVRIQGPAARDLQVIFVEDWFLDTNESLEDVLAILPPAVPEGATVQTIATGPAAYNEAMRQLSQVAFHDATEELIVTTPYFVPDEATESALYTTARRGVETTLVVPARNDSPLVGLASRSYYEKLLDSGVRIYEFQTGLLHAKSITLDRKLALVTTANLDRRSFELNFEVCLLVYDTDFASQVRLLQKSYTDDSLRVSADAWRARRWPRRLWQNATGMLSPLL
ncbi:MAG: cardiolipin synthase [Planctomycetota bacterium]|jgi:cardiolipin synthase